MNEETLAGLSLAFVAMCVVYSVWGPVVGEIVVAASVVLTFLLLLYKNSFGRMR